MAVVTALIVTAGAVAGAFIIGNAMSDTQSENVANIALKSLIEVSNQASQQCNESGSQIQSMEINADGSTVNAQVDWNQTLSLNATCMQSTEFQTDVKQIMNQNVEQIAKSLSQQFQLGDTESSNLVQATADLAIQVSNSFTQECSVAGSQTQQVVINATNEATVNYYANWDQYNESSINCVADNAAVSNTMQRMTQDTKQTAKATVRNFLFIIFGIIFALVALVMLVILGIALFGGFNYLTKKSKTPETVPGEVQSDLTVDQITPSAEAQVVTESVPAQISTQEIPISTQEIPITTQTVPMSTQTVQISTS